MYHLKQKKFLKIKGSFQKILMYALIVVTLTVNFPSKSYAQKIQQPIEGKKIEEFINQYMQGEMKKENIAGAAVVVVKDNKEIFKKGYGYSNLEKRIAVNPDVTTFPVASVSKLFTATAIMQLHAQGKIDLNTNIEKYISPLKIENPYEEDVTCANLLTHSSGMDEASELLGSTKDKNEMKSQEEYFQNHPLRLVEKPNTVSQYSNLGYNLLGYVIEKVSSVSYEDYIENNVLKPLGMTHSSVRLQDDNMANGYMYMDNKFTKLPFAYQYTSGSSGVIASVSDMGNFMKMHLNQGVFEGNIVLEANAERMMHEKMFSNDDTLPGMAYGFVRSKRNGQEIIKHEGALPGYMSTMLLLPEQNLGIFVTVNTFAPLPFKFEDAFLNHFFPKEKVDYTTLKKADDNLKKYVGTYRNYDGMARNNLMMCGVPLEASTDLVIKNNGDGTLKLEEYTQAREKISTTLYAVSKGKFIREDGRGNFAFRMDANGKIRYAFNDVSHNAYQRIPWYQEKIILLGIMAIAILLFFVDIGRTIRILIKRKKEKNNLKRKIRGCNLMGDIFTSLGSIGTVYLLQMMIISYDYNFMFLLKVLLTCIVIGLIWTVIRTGLLINQIIKTKKITKEIIYSSFVIIFSLLYNIVLNYCNLIGYKVS
ncbi:MAG: serine hydrolase domain-containing protein [Cellulosilyticaceae bacterium]